MLVDRTIREHPVPEREMSRVAYVEIVNRV